MHEYRKLWYEAAQAEGLLDEAESYIHQTASTDNYCLPAEGTDAAHGPVMCYGTGGQPCIAPTK